MTKSAASKIAEAKKKTLQLLNPHYSQNQTLALAARILADNGHGGTLSGQISCRDVLPNGNLGIWVQKYGLGIEELVPKDFILVDDELTPADPEEEGFPNFATRFHAKVYQNRPDIQSIVHSHPRFTTALSMTGQKLMPQHMDFMCFYDEVQFLEEWPGVPFGDEEGDIISGVLGESHWSALLANHGLITTGRTIEEATFRAFFFERAAEAQLLAMAASKDGKLKEVKRELGIQARDWRISEGPVMAHFRYWSRLVLQESAARRAILGQEH